MKLKIDDESHEDSKHFVTHCQKCSWSAKFHVTAFSVKLTIYRLFVLLTKHAIAVIVFQVLSLKTFLPWGEVDCISLSHFVSPVSPIGRHPWSEVSSSLFSDVGHRATESPPDSSFSSPYHLSLTSLDALLLRFLTESFIPSVPISFPTLH